MGRPAIRSFISAATIALAAGAAARAEPVGADGLLASYVVLGADGAANARVITAGVTCPNVVADRRILPMSTRAGPATLPLRPTASKPELSKPSAFPVTVCEATLPAGTRRASVLGRALPLAPRRVDRLVVIGDTGCRLKASDNAFQACNDPKAYPFATVAARVAAWKPDLIVHVGDYLYRENPCPAAAAAACAGSPWGYGWDAWNADFFSPGAAIFAAAPMVLARGNHEDCNRAGQGWFRLLDPRPLDPAHDCNDAANDFAADDSPPYAVPLGGGEQLVVMDLAIAPPKALAPEDPRAAQFRADWQALKALSERSASTLMVTHKPTLAFAAKRGGDGVQMLPGNEAIQSVFGRETPNLFPPRVDVLLSGHVHLWQQLSFANDYPTQFVTGFSGTQEETEPLPASLPPGATPAPGAIVAHYSSWIDGFGYMTLVRAGPRRWTAEVWNLDGKVVNRCRIDGRKSSCDVARVN